MRQQILFLSSLLLPLLFWANNNVCGTDCSRTTSADGMVAYCDLVTDPDKYDGKEVTVRATYRYGFEWQEVFCMECRKIAKTWLEFDGELNRESKARLKKFPRDQGTVNATFTGTFHSSKGPYGDGGYRFQFDVRAISSVEVLSKQGWDPDHLPAESRKRVCNGQPNPTNLLGGRDLLGEPN
jgi:hypothetical protein